MASKANKMCKSCGTMIAGEYDECPHCGTPIGSAKIASTSGSVDSIETSDSSGQAGKFRWLKIGCLSLFGLFLFITVLGVIFGDNSSNNTGVDPDDTVTTGTSEDIDFAIDEPPSEPVNKPEMTKAEFEALQTGMSYSRAVEIIGSSGEVISESEIVGIRTVMYSWDGDGGLGANANVMFQNGELVTKAQLGLE